MFKHFYGMSTNPFEKGIKEFFSPHPTLIPTIYPKENIPIIVTLFMRSLHWNITHKNYIGIFHFVVCFVGLSVCL